MGPTARISRETKITNYLSHHLDQNTVCWIACILGASLIVGIALYAWLLILSEPEKTRHAYARDLQLYAYALHCEWRLKRIRQNKKLPNSVLKMTSNVCTMMWYNMIILVLPWPEFLRTKWDQQCQICTTQLKTHKCTAWSLGWPRNAHGAHGTRWYS